MQKFISIPLLGLIAVTSLAAQKADEVIAANIEARGGYGKIKTLHTAIFEGRRISLDRELLMKVYYLHNKGMRSEFTIAGKTGYTIYTTAGGWTFNPFDGKGVAEVPAAMLKDILFQLDIHGIFLDYKEKGYKAEYQGKDTAYGQLCDKIILKKEGEGDKIYFFDTKNLLLKTIMYLLDASGGYTPSVTYYLDYRKEANGFVFSYKRVSNFETIFSTITTNSPINEAIFKPAN